MTRFNKTIQNYQEKLTDKGIKDIPVFIQSILDADITKGKYSRFLLDCYLNDKFRKEDLKGGLDSTVGEAITLFHKHKGKLPEKQRSVYQYETPGDLWNAVKQFDGELSGKEMKKEEHDRIYGETEFIYEDAETGFKIISPLTRDAAKWWGRGTRWCTAAENNNMFKNYAEISPLIIILMPDGKKLQAWRGLSDVQFMDEIDNDIKIDYIEEYWSVLEPVIKYIGDFNYIPEEKITEELCKIIIKQDKISLKYIPEEFKTEEICEIAIQKKGTDLKSVPEKHMKETICILAIKQNIENFYQIPEKLKTEEIYKTAINQNGNIIGQIPKKMITEEICKLAVAQNGIAFCHIPEEMITEKLCKLAVSQNGIALKFIPEKYRTEEIYKIAVSQYGYNLHQIPKEMITEEMCKLAIKNNSKALLYVPEELKTKEICNLALQQNKQDLQYTKNHSKEEPKQDIIPSVIQKEKYQQIFSEIRSYFPEKTLSLTI